MVDFHRGIEKTKKSAMFLKHSAVRKCNKGLTKSAADMSDYAHIILYHTVLHKTYYYDILVCR